MTGADPDFLTLADTGDFCRECRGEGWLPPKPNGFGQMIRERCPACGATGNKTAAIHREPRT